MLEGMGLHRLDLLQLSINAFSLYLKKKNPQNSIASDCFKFVLLNLECICIFYRCNMLLIAVLQRSSFNVKCFSSY